MRPGRTVQPDRSITCAPGGGSNAPAACIPVMRSPLTTIHRPSRTFPAAVSITRPVRMTIVGAGGAEVSAADSTDDTSVISSTTPDGARQRSVILLLPVSSSCGAPPALPLDAESEDIGSWRLPSPLGPPHEYRESSSRHRRLVHAGCGTATPARTAVRELRNVFFPSPGELLPQSRLLGDRVRGRRAVAHGPHLVVHQRLLRAARALRGAQTLRALRDRRGRARAREDDRAGPGRRRCGRRRARGRDADGARARDSLPRRRHREIDLEVEAGGELSMSGEVVVLGVGMHPWGKWGRNFVEYGVHAARAALADAGVG